MSFPNFSSIEIPILQELAAVGGADDIRYLYERLTGYFPQITQTEISEIKTGKNKNWRVAVQKAGKSLDEQNFINRERGIWSITKLGSQAVVDESSGFALIKVTSQEMSHPEVQEMLVNIGEALGYSAQSEFEYYDVVWRISSGNQRLSHIFEVQSKGNIDSAFAKLKRGYDAQRSKTFLVLSSESNLNRARKSLDREFQELSQAVTILTFQQVLKVYQNIKDIGQILAKFLEK